MIPKGYKILDWLNGVIFDRELGAVIDDLDILLQLHALTHDDIQIANNGDESNESIQMVLIGRERAKV